MAKGYTNPTAPNKAATVSGAALKGKRTKNPRLASNETMADRKVNTKSSNNTPKLSVQNQRA